MGRPAPGRGRQPRRCRLSAFVPSENSAAELPPELAADLTRQTQTALGLAVTGWQALAGGTNNRIFRLQTAQGTPLIAKLYHRDQWSRQKREFGTLFALRGRGLAGVPAALFHGEGLGYAVYSFAPGTVPRPAQLTPDQMRRLGAFAAALHRIEPEGEIAALPPAISATFSTGQQMRRIEERLDAFERVAGVPNAPATVRHLAAELGLRERLGRLVEKVTAGIDPADRERELPAAARRLSSGDFGAHNLLVDDQGAITVNDWEWSGWDDPAQLAMGFVAHAGSEGLSAEAAAAFLDAYAARADLSAAEMARFERAAALIAIEWAATIAGAVAPEALAARRFAVSGFDEDAFVAGIGELVRRRLARASSGMDYRFPRGA